MLYEVQLNEWASIISIFYITYWKPILIGAFVLFVFLLLIYVSKTKKRIITETPKEEKIIKQNTVNNTYNFN